MRRIVRLAVWAAGLMVAVSAMPVQAADPPAGSTGGLAGPEAGWVQDPAFVAAKNEGRVIIDASGNARVLAKAPTSLLAVAASKVLDTSWTTKVLEPRGTGGTDDSGVAYTDRNHWNLCAPGAATVTLWYWANAKGQVTGIAAASYLEPNAAYKSYVDYYKSTYWKATDTAGNGRGYMMWLAYKEKPTGTTWQYPGVFNWSSLPNTTGYGTPQSRLVQAVNWEASGHTNLKFFYVWVPESSLTKVDFHAHVVSDITQSVPVLVAARTSNGTQHLPQWSASGSKINHQIAVVGYNDTAGTYSVMDTCGPGCNSSGLAAAVRTIDQDDLWTLIHAETDHDGIIW